MKRRIILVLTTIAILLSFLLGCGVAPEKYDQMAAKLQTALSKIAEMQGETNDLIAEKEAVAAQLQVAQARVAELEGQAGGLKEQLGVLKEQYELVGATPAETAENIVRYYHETHVYSTDDFYVCGDMASDVWNMLKAQGINARIAVGNNDSAIGDILDSNHAWVLAEVAAGEYLALETTGGFIVPRSENPLYYKGWYFKNPAELKSYQQLREEYNVRVGIINQLVGAAQQAAEEYGEEVDRYNDMVDEYNAKYSGKPVSAESRILEARLEAQGEMVAEKEDRFNQLEGLVDKQEAEMNSIMSEVNGLATRLP